MAINNRLPDASPRPDVFAGIETEMDAEGLFAFAVWHQSCGHMDQALACYRQAVRRAPGMAEAYYNMGVLHYEQRHWQQAVEFFSHAVALRPQHAMAIFNLAAAYKENHQYPEAIATYEAFLRLDPKSQAAHYYKAMCLQTIGDHIAALSSFQQALKLNPDNAMIWFQMAETVRKLHSIDQALQCYRKAVEVQPDWDRAHYNLSIALHLKGHHRPAMAHMQRALDLNPDFSDAHGQLYRMAQHACDWALLDRIEKNLDRITAQQLRDGVKTSELPMINIRRCADPEMNLNVARSWSRHIAHRSETMSDRPIFHHVAKPVSTGRLRIGYLSGDFKEHAVARQIRGMLVSHNRHQFEIIGYASNPDDGTAFRRHLASACDDFKSIHHLSDAQAARLIHADGIHILVELSAHSRDNRMGITALRPCPIQVSYLGFLGTSGADFIDYIIADRVVVPPAEAKFYTEKLVYLPDCYQANDDLLTISATPIQRADVGLPPDTLVFCSFNQPYKIDRQLFEIWMNILRDVDNSVLWLIQRSELAKSNLQHAAAAAGIDPSRLIFTGFVPMDVNLARLRLADLVLDTRIYNGGATTSNALWAGVPVLAMYGRHWVSRMSASALYALDLSELVTSDLQTYRQRAIELARNPHQLKTIREKLAHRRQRMPLFDTALFTRHMESAFSAMWERFAAGLPPAVIEVDAHR